MSVTDVTRGVPIKVHVWQGVATWAAPPVVCRSLRCDSHVSCGGVGVCPHGQTIAMTAVGRSGECGPVQLQAACGLFRFNGFLLVLYCSDVWVSAVAVASCECG